MWAGNPHKMVQDDDGSVKCLHEQGIDRERTKADDMRFVLSNHFDFATETTIKESHLVYFVFKFHYELNPNECVWTQAKMYVCLYTNLTF